MSSWQEERLCGLRTQRGEMINTQCALRVDAPFVWIGQNTQRHMALWHLIVETDIIGCLNDISPKKLNLQEVLAHLEPAMPSARGQ